MPLVPYLPPHIEFLSAWGKKGSLQGEFNEPQGVASDSLGNLYVADFGNQRVQKFNSSGIYVAELTGIGAIDVAVDSLNNLYITDGIRNCVWKIDSSFTPVTSLGSSGAGDYQFNIPSGIAVAGSYVYVTDNGNNRIMKFESSLSEPGSYVTQWGAIGAGDGQFNGPAKVAVNAFDYVYVTDSGNNRVQKFDSSGTFVCKWGSIGSGDGEFDSPIGMALYSSVPLIGPKILLDYVFVADYNNNRVQMFGIEANSMIATASYMTKWGSFGSSKGRFNHPYGVGLGGAYGIEYIVDSGNNRIQEFTALLYHVIP
jgi:DNA-binding beta-propeller fold protein YncE